MISINNQMQIMNTLSLGLSQDVLDLRSGKLNENKATVISRLAGKAIKAIAEGVMLANHQEIQKSKIKASLKRTEAINRNIDFKNKKLNQFKIVKSL
jgi:hypothetical protein